MNAAGYAEAAAVCLSRHHETPTDFQLEDDQAATTITLLWDPPSPQIRLAWANTTDATEAGAYACALAAIAHTRELYAIQRAETLTGSDYYIAPISDDGVDLENCYRVEISGTDLATLEVRRRLNVKLRQLRSGQSDLPAIAIVIGFKASLILIQGLKMSWTEHHNRSTTFASQAQVFKWQGEVNAAKEHYALAAEAETQALQALDPEKSRTLGITAVSATALWYKAEEFPKAKQIAYQWLASDQLPQFAIVQLEEILREILTIEAAIVAG